jgi:hypothetical protein
MSPGTGRRLSESRGSIPQVPLFELEIVPPQERQVFFLKGGGPVMIRLCRDVLFHGLNVGMIWQITNQERGTTLRTENQMIMQTRERLRHREPRGMNLCPSGAVS